MTSSLGGGIAAATVTVTPNGGAALPAVHTGADGRYSVGSVPAGSGTVAVSGVSVDCTAPNVATYSDVSAGSTARVDVAVTCHAPMGTVVGTVTSSLGEALGGVAITETPQGVASLPPVRTDNLGKYTIGGTPVGGGVVSLSALPALCTTPQPASYTGVTDGATKVVNVVVMCSMPTGTVSGTITSSLGGGLSGASVTVTPAGSAALPPVLTAANGSYSVSRVPLANGTGSVSVTNVPAGCTSALRSYTGLTAGSVTTANLVIACQVATGTVINHCQTISASGSYILSADVSGTVTNGYCLTIDANDVALDCGGHTIADEGTGATIVIEAVQRVAIKNCTVVATGSGSIGAIVGYGPQHLTISDVHVRVTAPGATGIVIANGQDFALTQSTIVVNTELYYAIYLSKALRAQLTNNQITTNGRAAYIQDSSSYVAFANSTLSDTGGAADIIVANGHNNKVTGNMIDGGWRGARLPYGAQGTDDGIGLSNEDGDTISLNVIANVFDAAVEAVGVLTHSEIAGNTATSIGATGIGAYWGTSWMGNHVQGNHVSGAVYLTFILYDGNSLPGYQPVSSINFLNNSFDGNAFDSPVITNFANVASIVISFAGTGQGTNGLPLPSDLGQNSISNNVLPSSIAAFDLLPAAAFINGGGNVCNVSNAGNAPFCGAASTSTFAAGATASMSPAPRLSPFPRLPPEILSEMSRRRGRMSATR